MKFIFSKSYLTVELNQSYSTPNNIYCDESNFYTEIQYASGLENSPDNTNKVEITETHQNRNYSSIKK